MTAGDVGNAVVLAAVGAPLLTVMVLHPLVLLTAWLLRSRKPLPPRRVVRRARAALDAQLAAARLGDPSVVRMRKR